MGTETESEHWEPPWAVVGLARPHTGVLSARGASPWRVEEPGDPPAPTLWHDPPLQMGGVATPPSIDSQPHGDDSFGQLSFLHTYYVPGTFFDARDAVGE